MLTSWATLLQPDLVLGAPVIELTPDILAEHGLRGLVLDVDETLVPLRSRQASAELQQWVAAIRQETALWLVSNNLSEGRIGNIARSLDVPYILGARKPSRRKLRQAVQEMNLPVESVAMVGDRLFTDVLAGNRLGTFTILVEPMVDPAIAARDYPLRAMEVRLSQWLGVSLSERPSQAN
ncbi:HAD superfamily (subfamily IIIA) phosphatase [Rubidibacter lacunae KORDI 51-2]|uniref:HAD superfamily (Subfamily IIIA) phosphatase n=1 Tax=Rubidibacter lacunae KORDI 51-2 TaxID=582515 RepID=U5DR69_9CHRO|nr:YqeG family HAD IIIA-type phosphatase [Rubidibacter lacunae]ERN43094.1 HAD superfamily (subfamily IIIA) phosphatase [Rubidibacter lacunae KORDI 51-2]